MFALAPLEILFAIAVFILIFKVFVRLLNSKKLSKTIDEVTHPQSDSDEDIVQAVERSLDVAEKRVAENDEEVLNKLRANHKLRRYKS